jgi:hypothetical protein
MSGQVFVGIFDNVALSLSGNTEGTLTPINSGTAILAGGNNITLSQSGNAISIIGGAGGGGGNFTAGVSGGNTAGASGTVSNEFVLAGGTNITLSGATGAGGMSVSIVGATQTAQTQNCVDLSLAGNSTSAGVGYALISSGTAILAGGNNITLSQNGQSVTISAFAQSVQTQSLGSDTLGMSNLSNTAGTSGVVSGSNLQLVFAGGNNITLSQSLNGSSGTITISAFTQTVQTQNMVAVSLSGNNTTGTEALISSGTMLLAGSGAITISQNNQSLTINDNAVTLSKYYWPPIQAISNLNSAVSLGNTSSASVQYVPLPNYLAFSRVDVPLNVSVATAGNASTAWMLLSNMMVIYSLNGTSFSPIVGTSQIQSWSWSSNATASVTGFRNFSFPLQTTLSPGEYYAGFYITTSSGYTSGGGNTTALNASFTLIYNSAQVYASGTPFADFGAGTASSSNIQLRGIYTTQMSATNQTLSLGALSVTGSASLNANVPLVFRNY